MAQKIALITGSSGLVGSEAAQFFAEKGFAIVGIDNNSRAQFFGSAASTDWMRNKLQNEIGGYVHFDVDIRDQVGLERVFSTYSSDIDIVIHSAAQPSHDWAARFPQIDFSVNANGTINMLEMTRAHCSNATFIFTSTNKVYGDRPNQIPLVELESRWEVSPEATQYVNGIDETLSVDQSTHSLFGASKLAADVLVQEYGRYFGLSTGVFRGGCLTGGGHSGTSLHGFLSYLVKCTLEETPYNVLGHNAKQVRDNIHARDLVRMFWSFHKNPRPGEVYNVGGSRHSNCSMLEAIDMVQQQTEKTLSWTYIPEARIGDHRWYISDISKFISHYPEWDFEYSLDEIISEIVSQQFGRMG